MSVNQALITGLHAHVYYEPLSAEAAKNLCMQAAALFGVDMGRAHMHQ